MTNWGSMASNYFLFTKTITENLTAPHPTEASTRGHRTERSLSMGYLQKKKKKSQKLDHHVLL